MVPQNFRKIFWEKFNIFTNHTNPEIQEHSKLLNQALQKKPGNQCDNVKTQIGNELMFSAMQNQLYGLDIKTEWDKYVAQHKQNKNETNPQRRAKINNDLVASRELLVNKSIAVLNGDNLNTLKYF